MFELGRVLAGADESSLPAFRLVQGASHGFAISVALRSLTGAVGSYPLGQPVGIGEFFWVPLLLAEGDQTAVQNFPELESPALVSGGRYWEYLGIGAGAALGIMVDGVEGTERTFSIATREALSVGYPLDWAYRFDLSAKPGVSVVEVDCLGQHFTSAENPSSPTAGEWVLSDGALWVYGSEVNQLRDYITLTTTFTALAQPDSFWVEFSCEWLTTLVVEQVSCFGQIFTLAENPWHPAAGEYLVNGTQLFLFTKRPIFPASTALLEKPKEGGQFLGNVSL